MNPPGPLPRTIDRIKCDVYQKLIGPKDAFKKGGLLIRIAIIKNQILFGWPFFPISNNLVLLQEFLDLALLTRCEGWKLLGCIDESLDQLAADLAEWTGHMA
jgi:hypothetical protein